MAIFLYRNALLFVNGASAAPSLHELSVEYNVEVLDATRFGDDTRRKKGGLFVGKIAGKGFVDSASGLEAILFGDVGASAATTGTNPAYQSGSQIEDVLVVVFPDGVTENSTTTGMGYACKGVLSNFAVGGPIGTLFDITFAAESRGIAA